MRNLIISLVCVSVSLTAVAEKHPQPTGELMVRLAKIAVHPERLHEYNDFLKEEIEASLVLEPNVLSLYAVSEKENPENITILEIYADKEAYLSHIQTPHFIKYKEGTADMVTSLDLIETTPLMPTYNKIPAASDPIVLQEQGSFAVGGVVLTNEEGHTFHGDHASVFYQIPSAPKKYPLVYLHGIYQFSKTWETTPDGREGFHNIFLRRGYPTYNVNVPRRGNAGRSTVEVTISPQFDEARWFNTFRVGNYPDYFEGVQFPKDEESLDQYMRQQVPNIGPIDFDVNSNAIAALFEKTGPAIMVCHSHGGPHTWYTMMKTDKVKAVVAWEPGGRLPFPDDEAEPVTLFPTQARFTDYMMVSPDTFERYTKVPILIIFGDYIPEAPTGNPGQDEWAPRLELSKMWAEKINNRGGDATVIHLPEIGIYGNTHFPFSDLNNVEMADLMHNWLKEKELD